MSIINIETAFNIDLEFTTAPTKRRVLAVLIDMLILLVYIIFVYRFVFVFFNLASIMNYTLMMSTISILPFFYFPICEIMLNGQTVGKRMMHIKVIDLNGNEASLSQFLLRWLIGFGNYAVFLLPYIVANSSLEIMIMALFFLFALCLFYLPDFLCINISKYNQRFADIAAGTLVIDLNKKMDFGKTIFLEIKTNTTEAKYPQVMKLSDRDINGIKNLLDKKENDWAYVASIVEKICQALKIETRSEDDKDFLEQLLEDYNFLTQKK